MAFWILSTIRIRAWTVEWLERKPNCGSKKIDDCSKYLISLLYISLTRILLNIDIYSEIGR